MQDRTRVADVRGVTLKFKSTPVKVLLRGQSFCELASQTQITRVKVDTVPNCQVVVIDSGLLFPWNLCWRRHLVLYLSLQASFVL